MVNWLTKSSSETLGDFLFEMRGKAYFCAMAYPLLDKIDRPADLRSLRADQLAQLASELRSFIQSESQEKIAHIKSSLGVVELSIALHYHFNTPEDILIWDVGHQAYAHKVLTERRAQFASNRIKGGIAGFTRRSESEYDPFGAGHSSTSISALAGFCQADRLSGKERTRLAVIGDGALTGGMAFEGLNYIGEQGYDCWVVLNDNRSSIDANIGALQARDSYADFAKSLGFSVMELAEGNDIASILKAFQNLENQRGPKFLILRSQKALGFEMKSDASVPAQASFQSALAERLKTIMQENPKVILLSPAMLSGAGLHELQHRFPERVLDVGIAEQHAVTMAAGLAAAGYKPIVHLYSTFSQRALDQIIHDVALQKLPVTFLIDRAGLVGADGPTHHGNFDQALLSSIPNVRIGTAADGNALAEILTWALAQDQDSIWIRYAKESFPSPSKWRSYRPHWWLDQGRKQVILSYGAMAHPAQAAAEAGTWSHLHLPIYKPFPEGDLQEQLKECEALICIDENPFEASIGARMKAMKAKGLIAAQVRSLHLPDQFIDHAKRSVLLSDLGLSKEGILALAQDF